MSSENKGGSAQTAIRRVDAVDQVRAIAILALITAHFGPAIIERVQPAEPIPYITAMIGRFATPAFVAIFGITCGIVYMHRAATNFSSVRSRMTRRALLLLVCVIAISIPSYISLWRESAEFKSYLLTSYGILAFYTGAVLVMPWAMRLLQRRPLALGLGAGAVLWMISYLLGFYLWPHDPEIGYGELVRLYLVSGKYGFFAMLGTAILCIPAGMAIRRAALQGERVLNQTLLRFGLGGIVLAALGAVLGIYAGNPASQIPYTPGGPPRAWFFALMCGATFMLLPVLYALRNMALLKHPLLWLSALGSAALPLYVGHHFVIPISEQMRRVFPQLSDTAVLGISGLGFLVFVVVLIVRHLPDKKQRISSAGMAGSAK